VYFGNIYLNANLRPASRCVNMREPSVVHLTQCLNLLGRATVYGYESEGMGFLSEFRHPTTWYSQIAIAVLTLLFFILLAAAAISGYQVYRIVSPGQSHSEIDLQNFPGHPETLPYTVAGETPRDGWFFPGLKSAPTVMLCPGYQSSRGELLTLASALQEHQYNVLLIDFSGHGTSGGRTTLGFQEVAELRAAMNAVANRGDVDVRRFGVWGVNLGGYVALAEAENDPRIRAIAVESAYDRPEQMVGVLAGRSGLGSLPLVVRMVQWEFRWVNYQYRKVPPLRAHFEKLAGVAQLYLESSDDPALASSTTEIFSISPGPHELVVLPKGNYAGMLDDEKHNYENRIVSFFLENLPPAGEQ
jgi:pimeloyl-ACP methyl ester carboxylesterase